MTDNEYEDVRIASVEPGKNGWTIARADGGSFWCPDVGIEPHVGGVARFYGRGFGYVVRGLEINGQRVFYQTAEEQQAEAGRQRAESDRQKQAGYDAKAEGYERTIRDLPAVFQRRIARFRRTNPDFNWQFLPYELSCCVDGAKIALHCQTGEAVKAFHDLTWPEQQALIPDLFDGHSGNSFGFACRLASYYVTEPRYIPLEHGAISILVGCDEFGCQPGDGLEGEDLAFYRSLQAKKGGAS